MTLRDDPVREFLEARGAPEHIVEAGLDGLIERWESAVEDVEVETPHYRGAHAAAKARSGFTCYRASGARVGGGSTRGGAPPFDPGHAEDLVS